MQNRILLDAGSGGRASQRLIYEIFLKHFQNETLAKMDDAAALDPLQGKLAMSADGYTVSPLFFKGGSIGTLAINGTVNDVAMLGASPLWLSASFIIEEGLEIAVLDRVAADMAAACQKANVKIVTGDTKVVPKGACDKLFVTTTGLGEIYADPQPSGCNAKAGDAILVSGCMGDHGMAILSAREGMTFLSDAVSDCAPLNQMIRKVIESVGCVHTLRDPTRGGLAATLNEIAEQSSVCMEIEESEIPVKSAISASCSFLGLDPFYLANEGKCICILPQDRAQIALQAMRASEFGREAAIIGKVTNRQPGKVILRTRMGGERLLDMLEGAPLPRIC